MTQLDRVLAVFHGEQPEVMPWIGDLTYWHSAHERLGDTPERWKGTDGFRQLHEDLGIGLLCDYASGMSTCTNEGDLRTEQREEAGCVVTELITPVGTLTCREKFLPESHCSAPLDHYVKVVEDLEVVRYIADQRRYAANDVAFSESREKWQGLGPMVALPPRSPLSALFTEWAGVVTTCYLLADHRREVEKTMQALAESQARALTILESSPAELIEFPDNLSAANQGGFFDAYLLPHYRPIVERFHAAGKFVGAHLDGTLLGLLNRMPETGMDFIESITPAPVGDVSLGELRSLVPPDFVLIGGVPGASFAVPWDWPKLREHVVELIRCHKGSPFILGTADQVPPDGDISFAGKVAELLEERACQ